MKKILMLALALGLVFGNTEIQAQKKKKKGKSEETATPPKKKNGGKIKPYKDVITDKAISDDGLFGVHKVEDKYYFEIADSLLEREILVVSRIAGTIENFNFGGAGMKAKGSQIWRWQKKDNKILIRSVQYNSVASNEKPIYESVRNNNFEPIIMTFDIKALSQDSSGYVIEVNPLFTTDVQAISPLSSGKRRQFGVKMLDKSRSMINYMKSFPLNTEVRHILTWKADKIPANASTGTLSMELNQSFVLLDKEPMIARNYDKRVQFFSIRQTDYGTDAQKALNRRFITKWKLEPKDEAAYLRGELVEPKKPIVYYIDPATPKKWVPYLMQGINDWEVAFRAAGFKNAIMAKVPPTKEEDPDWSPEDVRYSVLRYTANPIQNAMGPHVADPRSGEIIESDIIWYHNVMNLLRNWFFIQTAAVNEDARKVAFDEDVMGELVRFVSAHEVGHTLGFPHNMGASYSYPTDSLRSKTFTEKMGVSPSIMDYARFNYVAQPGDDAYLFPKIGEYDKWAVKYGYTWFPNITEPDDEKETLNKWVVERSNDQIYWFGQQRFNPSDPRAQTEDIGNDAMKSGEYGIANLKRILPNLIEWTEENGKDYDDLNELYANVLGQWGRYIGHVTTNVGGVYETHKTYEQSGAVYEFVPKATQKEAMRWIQKNAFKTPTWVLDENVLNRIESTGSIERVSRYQTRALNGLTDFSRLARMLEAESKLGSRTYTAREMFADLRNGVWSEIKTGRTIDPYRRNLQRTYLESMERMMTQEQPRAEGFMLQFSGYSRIDVASSDIRALVRANLRALKSQVRSGISKTRDDMSKFHLEDALVRIDNILDPKG